LISYTLGSNSDYPIAKIISRILDECENKND